MNRESKIQEAMKKAESSWDDKFNQDDWVQKELPRTKIPKSRRIGGGFASKAMKNL